MARRRGRQGILSGPHRPRSTPGHGPGPRPSWATDEIWNAIQGAWQQAPGGFTPFKAPTRPPTGTYDPVLDAQEGAANRGLADLVMDTETDRTRSASDLGLARSEIERQAGYATQDFNTQEADVRRNTALTGQVQAGQARAQGVRGGGVLAAALVRQQNQARAIAPIDTGRARLAQNVQQQMGQLDLGYARHGEDVTQNLTRAERENTQFGLDTSAQRFFQATQTGWDAPTAPANEHTKRGVTYRVRGEGPGRKYRLPNGTVLGRQDWVNMWRRRRAGNPFPTGYGIGGAS
jgi:hypothetical protein